MPSRGRNSQSFLEYTITFTCPPARQYAGPHASTGGVHMMLLKERVEFVRRCPEIHCLPGGWQ